MALWNERDISHSSTERIILPDACLALDYSLDLLTGIIKGLKVNLKNMERNLELTRGLAFSQRVLTSLVESGTGREEAYKIVQRNAMEAWNEGLDFRQLLRDDPEVSAIMSLEELESLFDYRFYVRHVDDVFKRLDLE